VRFVDLSSWQGVLATGLGLALFAVIGVGIRVIMMLTIQQRQQRMNRQINERLKTLISAYKTLGGSFTGQLTVNPLHLRDLRVEGDVAEAEASEKPGSTESDRPRRIRDAVEAALADILLLGTDEHVRLAGQAASVDVLQNCASSPAHFFDAKNGAELREAFRAIGRNLNGLRLTS
jgi:hypothetical protein